VPWYVDILSFILAFGTAYLFLYLVRKDYDGIKVALGSAGVLNMLAAITYGSGFWASFCCLAFAAAAVGQFWGSGLDSCREKGVAASTAWSGYALKLGVGYVPVYMYVACKMFGDGTLGLTDFFEVALVAVSTPFIPTSRWIVARCDFAFAFSSFKSRSAITNFSVEWWDEMFAGTSNAIMNEMITHKVKTGEWVEMTLPSGVHYFCRTWLENALKDIRDQIAKGLRLKVDDAVAQVAGVLDAPEDVARELISLPDNGLFVCNFPDGVFYVAESNRERLKICPICGKVSLASDGNRSMPCSDYCRETARINGVSDDRLPHPKVNVACSSSFEFACHQQCLGVDSSLDLEKALKDIAKKQVYKGGGAVISEALGESAGMLVGAAIRGRDILSDIRLMCNEEISNTQCAKNMTKHCGGLCGGALGAKFGGWIGLMLPLPGTAFIGAAIGGWAGNRYGSKIAKGFADVFADDDLVNVLAMVRDIVQLYAVGFQFGRTDVHLLVSKIDQEVLGDPSFVPSVVKVGNNMARCYVARRVFPFAIGIVHNINED